MTHSAMDKFRDVFEKVESGIGVAGVLLNSASRSVLNESRNTLSLPLNQVDFIHLLCWPNEVTLWVFHNVIVDLTVKYWYGSVLCIHVTYVITTTYI